MNIFTNTNKFRSRRAKLRVVWINIKVLVRKNISDPILEWYYTKKFRLFIRMTQDPKLAEIVRAYTEG